ncbi:DUF4258 domain-containing protein [Pseudomonas putida CSV86]|uniref:DUF4258 domain-containing protein n=2 Tax=Pseudomonas TaxID=286 RepID=A0A177SFW8_PSEPU|nr:MULTISPECIES: DUF4258 domain-containing protein [Pseudomonas]MDG9883586.1 DUF4258 domain-containing protein [Pseudomonas sp. GD04058]NNJ14862.1 DUF4258 domain-containing protein [Pseudomonas bharatica CSV86]OAI88211.1 hypothetical protein AYO28_24395 [Pseudomonas putida]
MSRQPLWTKQQLEEFVHALARDSARVVFTGHCLQRMEQRGVSTVEVLSCLRRGSIVRGPFYNAGHQSFEFRMSEPAPRDIVCVVAAVKPVAIPGELFAITVWEI